MASFPFDVGSSWWRRPLLANDKKYNKRNYLRSTGFFPSSASSSFFFCCWCGSFGVLLSIGRQRHTISSAPNYYTGALYGKRKINGKTCEPSERCATRIADSLALSSLAFPPRASYINEEKWTQSAYHSGHPERPPPLKNVCGRPTGVKHLNRRPHWYIACSVFAKRVLDTPQNTTILNSVYFCAFLIVLGICRWHVSSMTLLWAFFLPLSFVRLLSFSSLSLSHSSPFTHKDKINETKRNANGAHKKNST